MREHLPSIHIGHEGPPDIAFSREVPPLIFRECVTTSPNCAVPVSGQETRRVKYSVLEPVSNQDGPSATNGLQREAAGDIRNLLFELGVEPSLTIMEAAAILRWSYWKARRYFRHVDGICVSYQPKRYKRPYRSFTIPVSIFAREWQKMTGQEPEASDVIRHRLSLAIQK